MNKKLSLFDIIQIAFLIAVGILVLYQFESFVIRIVCLISMVLFLTYGVMQKLNK